MFNAPSASGFELATDLSDNHVACCPVDMTVSGKVCKSNFNDKGECLPAAISMEVCVPSPRTMYPYMTLMIREANLQSGCAPQRPLQARREAHLRPGRLRRPRQLYPQRATQVPGRHGFERLGLHPPGQTQVP